ncbi:hypothetical protein DW718_00785 [Weissella cibaria]|uniref:hypothetical protein n=1 Tax=Weissella cibaria TaxID=137591 RepID=UPI000E5411C8|nr:hypothetical protein [Weissella cibaria]RHE73794.1 hypothetical protein DW718_00785 [Weissella cibaria]RHE79529.1 hypothetical protein DW717_00785 [Weissella cibaria]
MDEDYENYTDDDYVNELKQYAQDIKSEQAQDEAERRKQLAEMVGGYMGLWWYLRSFSSSTARNIRTYAAVADREAKIEAWTNGTPEDSKSAKLSAAAEERAKKLAPFRDLLGSKDQKVMLINEFGACAVCAPYVGKTYTLEEAQELVPFHPNCRCTLVRVENDSKGALVAGISAGAFRYQDEKGPQLSDKDIEELLDYFDTPDSVLARGEDVDGHLDSKDALGVTWDENTILIHSQADRATLAEELYHRKQLMEGAKFDTAHMNSIEIEAKQFLIDNASVLKLSQVEIDATLSQMQNYK